MCLYKYEGSGNNWSYGYNIHGKSIKEDLINIFNKFLDKSKISIKNIILI